MAKLGIAGAGVAGRLLAYQLAARGHRVTVFDPAAGPEPVGDGSGAAGFTAAGMLSPLAELEHAPPEVAQLGARSLPLWQQVAAALAARLETRADSYLRCAGSLLLAHPSDTGSAQRVLARLKLAPALAPRLASPQALSAAELGVLEPELAPGMHAWLLAGEGQVFPYALLPALAAASEAVWCWGARVSRLSPGRLTLADGAEHAFDWVVDSRGLSSADALPLRGVRGEVLWLHAPGVALHRPLRLMHPRHRVYMVPRPGDVVVVGASEIESADRSPVSLRSAVELMAAAHSAMPALAEARILHLETNLRPALPDNLPLTHIEPGLIRLNGLFRHGWLMAPALVDDAIAAAGL
ncbi:FAD-dependent oxidoreductase [Craterilacuibacter sp. RT1T]|uniref:FAD-dependent oxidoreductase n=1 Tax=Craterilacuibacter sp. RT1T TaxID=2942211 RepID=UPI0020BF8F45|nr:FAD-dependent oxidoreductase [Craterilacuibacter sp. RT1T]MCL6263230.1 FAD-dependent oxidoreductase [Craterilacuibacter sp. RT1T]